LSLPFAADDGIVVNDRICRATVVEQSTTVLHATTPHGGKIITTTREKHSSDSAVQTNTPSAHRQVFLCNYDERASLERANVCVRHIFPVEATTIAFLQSDHARRYVCDSSVIGLRLMLRKLFHNLQTP